MFLRELDGPSDSHHLQMATRATMQLAGLEGFDVPSWSALAAGVQPYVRNTVISSLALIVVGGSTKQLLGLSGSSVSRTCCPEPLA